MSLEEIREAIKNVDIDQLLSFAKVIEQEEVDEALELYEKFYEKELNIALSIQDILTTVKSRTSKLKIPSTGNYTYKLE
jgi:hypothetical protein